MFYIRRTSINFVIKICIYLFAFFPSPFCHLRAHSFIFSDYSESVSSLFLLVWSLSHLFTYLYNYSVVYQQKTDLYIPLLPSYINLNCTQTIMASDQRIKTMVLNKFFLKKGKEKEKQQITLRTETFFGHFNTGIALLMDKFLNSVKSVNNKILNKINYNFLRVSEMQQVTLRLT